MPVLQGRAGPGRAFPQCPDANKEHSKEKERTGVDAVTRIRAPGLELGAPPV